MKTLRIALFAALCLCSLTVAADDFKFTDTQGKVQRLADYRGKWLLVNFWATWCPPCEQETPDLVALHNARSKTDLAVIGMALDSTRASVAEFASKHKITYPLIIGSYTMAEQIGAVEVLPTSYLFDPNGKLVSYQEGMITRAELEQYIALKTKKK